MHSIAIIGAGVTGLTAAYRLKDHVSLRIFEAASRPRGVIRSERHEGYLVEHGPNTIKGGAPILEEVVDALDLGEERIYPGDTARKRFIVKNGRPVPLPLSLSSFITTPLFSTAAKLRLLKEPFISAPASGRSETVSAFVRRRFGQEFVDYGVNPFTAGIFAGDPDRLSMAHLFPRLYEMEQAHGSIARAALFSRSKKNNTTPTDRRIFTFRDGLQTLTDALSNHVRDALVTSAAVTGLAQNGNKWTLQIDRGEDRHTQSFDAVLLAVPLHCLPSLVPSGSVDLKPIRQVPSPPLSVLALGFERSQIAHALDGFGLLVPEKEPFGILGSLFSSSLAPGRAPEGCVLLTSFIGGMRNPEKALLSAEALEQQVCRDLDALLDITGAPTFRRHIHWPHAIPQYIPGYDQVLEQLNRLERDNPGLYVAGNFRRGVSVGDAMTSGTEAAERIL